NKNKQQSQELETHLITVSMETKECHSKCSYKSSKNPINKSSYPQPTKAASQRLLETQQPTKAASQRLLETQQPTKAASQRLLETQQPTKAASQRLLETQQPTKAASQRLSKTQPDRCSEEKKKEHLKSKINESRFFIIFIKIFLLEILNKNEENSTFGFKYKVN
ncbi:hypothetical protein Bpfe_015593, partial [Biomphalaria pfeifferi]